MEHELETAVYLVSYRDNGNEAGNYYSILGLCWDNDYLGFRGVI